MSTHCSPCTICGRQTACCNDTHALGIEIYGHAGSCENSIIPIGEFCSIECFMEIRKRLDERLEIVKQDFPELIAPAQAAGEE